ncbi:MAG TPA: DoxX family protein [Pyrinomonadaceae bacterium]|jgi:uncharacterized membrane protein
MNKRNKTIYWATTAFLAFGMLAQGLTQMAHSEGYVEMIVVNLGYPVYFLNIIGFWKILGVVAILIPGFKLLKEWAYAGFFFVMSGAAYSHFAAGDSVMTTLPALVLLIMIGVSWYSRPADRKIITVN